MKVKLLDHVYQGGTIKVNRRGLGAVQQVVQSLVNGDISAAAAAPLLDRARAQVVETYFVKDAVIEMSDTSAQKYIDAGMAEAYVEPAAEASS